MIIFFLVFDDQNNLFQPNLLLLINNKTAVKKTDSDHIVINKYLSSEITT